MASQTEKFTISLPRQVYELIERMRKEYHLSRSAMIALAIRDWVTAKREEKRVRSYIEGYRNYPETPPDIHLHGILAAESLGGEEWGE
ncbi:MAG: ribbon-helix-helix protein, CopG family [Deltaproteobacteria bacterium]|nr:ribbon-helix-helix protein, CopG family [Deltaproteobacteria bacterium]